MAFGVIQRGEVPRRIARGWVELALSVWGDFQPPAWHEHAACRGQDPAWWDGANTVRARAVCESLCPVRGECAADARWWEAEAGDHDRAGHPTGVVGGDTAVERAHEYARARLGVRISS
ncbi:WhiB family transcriptional regulator [Saccharopolyspora shandongensis]|uniref:WhiB family transcriptional regulator n=1 Tax=Saccharopolyspora shandongensis TaxID=418495 RepID=UPI0033E671AA